MQNSLHILQNWCKILHNVYWTELFPWCLITGSGMICMYLCYLQRIMIRMSYFFIPDILSLLQ